MYIKTVKLRCSSYISDIVVCFGRKHLVKIKKEKDDFSAALLTFYS